MTTRSIHNRKEIRSIQASRKVNHARIVVVITVLWLLAMALRPGHWQSITAYYAIVLLLYFGLLFLFSPTWALIPLASLVACESLIRAAEFGRYSLAFWLCILLIIRLSLKRGGIVRIPRRMPRFPLMWYAYVVVYAASILWAPSYVRWSAAKGLLPYIGFGAFMLLPFFVEDERVFSSAAICYIVAAASVGFYFALHRHGDLRAISDITNPAGITNALVVGIILSLLAWREIEVSGLEKLMLLMAVILMGIVIAVGLSRKTIGAAVVSILAAVMLRPGLGRKAKFLISFILVVVVIGFIAYQIMPQAISHRLEETIGAPVEEVTTDRVYYWRAAWINFLGHPLRGTGARSFLYRYRESLWQLVGHSRSNVVHSMYLQVLAEQGLVGFVPLVMFVASLLGFSLSGKLYRDLFMGTAVFLTMMWIASSPINSPIYFLIGLLAKRLLGGNRCEHRESC